MNKTHADILTLMNAYCYCIDGGDIEGFAELFAHGSFGIIGDPDGAVSGKAEVVEYLSRVIMYEGKPNTKHCLSNVQIDIDEQGEKATSQSYITVFQAVPPDFPLQPIFSGHYHDSFEKVDGLWRFHVRDISPDLIGDLSFHLTQLIDQTT